MHPYRALLVRFSLWLRRSLNVLWLVLAAGYLMVIAGQAVHRSYQEKQDLQTLQEKLHQQELQRDRLKALTVYYGSDSFKEKELRRALLLKRPGEAVYALPESAVSRKLEEEALASAAAKQQQAEGPIWRQWIDYLLHRG